MQNNSIQVKVKCQYILYYLHVNDERFRTRERCLLKQGDFITFNKECDIQYREQITYYPCQSNSTRLRGNVAGYVS